MADIKIPREVLEAAAKAICAHIGSNWVFDGDPRHSEAREDMMAQAKAAFGAGLAAWPGACKEKFAPWSSEHQLILPLPQEPRT
jgi:hypothetical protein